MKYIFAVLLIALFSPLASATEDDYLVEGEITHHYPADGINMIELSCYCSNDVTILNNNSDVIELTVYAEYGSVGYHGTQIKPTQISSKLLNFTKLNIDKKLYLFSEEYIYMHHAYIIKKAVISVPENVRVIFLYTPLSRR